MNKAVTGTFHNAPATKAGAPIVGSLGATRAINDLRAEGFGGDAFALLRRERSEGQAFSSGARPLPFLELPKGIAIGAISGAILGAIAYWALGITMAWASAGINRPLVLDVVVLAIAGAVAGLLEGVAAMGPLRQAKRALNLLDRADETVSVQTDESHAGRAVTILRNAGAADVRRGAASLPGEFLAGERVQPEPVVPPAPATVRTPVEVQGSGLGAVESAPSQQQPKA